MTWYLVPKQDTTLQSTGTFSKETISRHESTKLTKLVQTDFTYLRLSLSMACGAWALSNFLAYTRFHECLMR